MDFQANVKISFIQPQKKKPYFRVSFKLPTGEPFSMNVHSDKQPAMYEKLWNSGEFTHKLYNDSEERSQGSCKAL